MSLSLRIGLPAIALLALVGPADAQVTNPHLRAALHELREARAELKAARDPWPPGHRDRALTAINDAIESIRVILSVKSVDDFKGVDRSADYYKRYTGGHPRLRAALHDLREARQELNTARGDFAGRKARALEDIDVAIGDIVTLIRDKKR